jgi:hypothetical protein
MTGFLYIMGLVQAVMHFHEAGYFIRCQNKAQIAATIFMAICWPVFVTFSMIYALWILWKRNA